MSEKLYPDVQDFLEQTDDGHVTLDEKELQKIFYNDRYNLMLQKKEELSSNIQRYLKSKKHYTLANNIQKITLLAVTSSLTIATIILTSGLAIPFFLIPTASGSTLFFLALTTSLDKIIKNKKLHLKKKIDDINTALAKVEVYIEKAREDGMISPDEIEHFNKLLQEYQVKKKKKTQKQEEDIEQIIEQVIRRKLNK